MTNYLFSYNHSVKKNIIYTENKNINKQLLIQHCKYTEKYTIYKLHYWFKNNRNVIATKYGLRYNPLKSSTKRFVMELGVYFIM